MPPSGSVRISHPDRSDVGCPHIEGCPLFPLLNGSIRGWRSYYCDNEVGWRTCARYEEAIAGRPVPITLLPNGAKAQHLRGISRPRPQQPQPSHHTGYGHPALFEPAPASAPPAGRPPHHAPPVTQAPRHTPPAPRRAPNSPPGGPTATAVRPPAQNQVSTVWPVPATHALDHPATPPVRTSRPARRRWWIRLADWITGPA